MTRGIFFFFFNLIQKQLEHHGAIRATHYYFQKFLNLKSVFEFEINRVYVSKQNFLILNFEIILLKKSKFNFLTGSVLPDTFNSFNMTGSYWHWILIWKLKRSKKKYENFLHFSNSELENVLICKFKLKNWFDRKKVHFTEKRYFLSEDIFETN